jgi:hypothetical protein
LTSCWTMRGLSCIAISSTVCLRNQKRDGETNNSSPADFLIQSGLAKQIRFHGKRYPWFVSDVTRNDWNWLLNTMVYGHLFPKATEAERESLRRLGARWKVNTSLSPTDVTVTHAFDSNTRMMADGHMSNILSGVLDIRSGTFTARHQIYSSTCPTQISSSSKVI